MSEHGLTLVPPGWQAVCACGWQGLLLPSYDDALDQHALHREECEQ